MGWEISRYWPHNSDIVIYGNDKTRVPRPATVKLVHYNEGMPTTVIRKSANTENEERNAHIVNENKKLLKKFPLLHGQF